MRRLYEVKPWRFAKLSHNRRYLHYADFEQQTIQDPGLDILAEKVDLTTISSVVSNVSAPTEDIQSDESSTAPKNLKASTKITIYSYVNSADTEDGESKEEAILTLHPLNHSLFLILHPTRYSAT